MKKLLDKQNQVVCEDIYKDYINSEPAQKLQDEVYAKERSIIKCRDYYRNLRWAKERGLVNDIEGKFFSIRKKENCKTVIYRMYPAIDSKNKVSYLELETIVNSVVKKENEEFQIFYIAFPDPKETLVVLHFYPQKGDIFLNIGELWYDKVKFNKRLFPVYNGEIEGHQIHHEAYSEDKTNDEIWYDASSESHTMIVDPSTGKLVKREFYTDENGNIKCRIKLKLKKNYFVFQITIGGNELPYRALTDLELGRLYRRGIFGFPQNYILALKHLEKLNDADASYEIAHIFSDSEEFRDETEADKYLSDAAQRGNSAAKVELALKYYFNGKTAKEEIARLLNEAVNNRFAPAMFLAGYGYEFGIFVEQDIEKAFDLYYRSAEKGYMPAHLRLAPDDKIDSIKDLWQHFSNNHGKEADRAKYCVACALYYRNEIDSKSWSDDMIEGDQKTAVKIFKELYGKGFEETAYDLSYAYAYGIGIEKDREKALKYYEKILYENPACYEYILLLADIKGDEELWKYFDVLLRAEKFDKTGNILLNIGKCYLDKRTGHYDVDCAEEYFLKSAEKGKIKAFSYLLKLYQEENVINDEIERKRKIRKVCEKGAELGNSDCKLYLENEKINEAVSMEYIKNKVDEGVSISKRSETTLNETRTAVEQIDKRLDVITKYIVHDLKEYIDNERLKLSKNVETDDEPSVSKFSYSVSDQIHKKISLSGDEIVKNEEDELSLLFGDLWTSLLPDSRASLVSASVMLKKCMDITIPSFDFSGICICATSALEIELKRVFFDGLVSYMNRNYGDEIRNNTEKIYDYWPEKLLTVSRKDYLNGNHKVKIETSFTMGALPFLFGETRTLSKEPQIREYQLAQAKKMQDIMRSYLAEIISESYTDDPYGSFYEQKETDKSINCKNGCFVWKCEKIRNDYRNKAAHVNVMSEEEATGCYQAIVNKPDIYMFNSEITGLMIELFSKIDKERLKKFI
ncbi:MAG: sel1 repeat family protein [Lachnospiraceae bacterium]|nr:sel1 repeat family protein [Lachnospiraceae bacterium]